MTGRNCIWKWNLSPSEVTGPAPLLVWAVIRPSCWWGAGVDWAQSGGLSRGNHSSQHDNHSGEDHRTNQTNLSLLFPQTVLVLASSCLEIVFSQQDFAAQYHIQTDLGDDRFFRFQTHTGQYRKEILRPDGTQEGTYGWVDPNGVLRLFDYIADGRNVGAETVSLSLMLQGSVTGLSRRVCSKSAPQLQAQSSPLVGETLTSGSRSTPWTGPRTP